MLSFKSEATYEIAGHGTFHTVKLDRNCQDFTHLIGKEIQIDGVIYKCHGVERHPTRLHWKDELIGLLVKPQSAMKEITNAKT
jgi:hypothetical protein